MATARAVRLARAATTNNERERERARQQSTGESIQRDCFWRVETGRACMLSVCGRAGASGRYDVVKRVQPI